MKQLLLLWLFAGALLLYAGERAWDRFQLVRRGVTVEGRVTELTGRRNVPAVAFRTRSGESVTFVSRPGTSVPKVTIGQSVPVVYDSGFVLRAEINSFGVLWSEVIASAVTALFAVGGVVALSMLSRRSSIALRKVLATELAARQPDADERALGSKPHARR